MSSSLGRARAGSVDIEQQRDRATLVGRLWVEHRRHSEGLRETLHTVGVLMQQIAQIGRRDMSGRDGQKHVISLPDGFHSFSWTTWTKR